ncbi:MAG: hypothetical protein ACXAC2_14325 [Candidatus Kariarchaeaceae archaeon]|jgi:hypothetical protein
MANFYKTLNQTNDIVNTRTLLHEAIPLTGTIVSGTYGVENIKNYSHGMFQSVYDYPYLSSSANHIFDITAGYANNSVLSASANNQNSKKINIYNQMAQVMMGYDQTGSILQFDEDGDLLAGGTKQKENIFLNFSRLLVKDEIKKGSFELEIGVTPEYAQNGTVFEDRIKLADLSGSDGYLVNSPVGEYGILYATQSAGTNVMAPIGSGHSTPVGLIFYQAGVAVITGSIFLEVASGGILNNAHNNVSMSGPSSIEETINAVLTGSQISGAADNIRTRIYNLQFNNTVELNSTVYFCRANHNEFNYSSNPTYLSGSKIRVKTQTTDVPVSYITTIGLYSDNNELMAVSKLSEPLKKTPDNEFTIRVRLDY